jgi:hypothetical protein
LINVDQVMKEIGIAAAVIINKICGCWNLAKRLCLSMEDVIARPTYSSL